MQVIETHLKHNAVETRLAVLRWIHHLLNRMPSQIFVYMEHLLPILLQMLSDASDEVVLLDLEVLSDVSQQKDTAIKLSSLNLSSSVQEQLSGISPYFVKFAISLLAMFRTDVALLNERGVLIIR